MGVHGLWKLIEPSGKPVPLETLENKILAVDISIWLHQAIKGFQDAKGASIPHAHLLGVYHRICKLLYFKIKPVFVFDGGVPVLKKQTIAKRAQLKSKNQSEADRIHKNLLDTLLKHTAINKVLSEKTKASISSISPPKKSKTDNCDELYNLPPTSEFDISIISSSSSSEEEIEEIKPKWDLHSIDTKSEEFKLLPIEVRHEILTDLKETRKQSSWGRINELPTESNDFSSFQMNRLLKRQSVQQALEEAEKEMGGFSLSLMELETLLTDQGIISKSNNKPIGNRIASDENTRFLYIKNIKEAIEEAKRKEEKLKESKEDVLKDMEEAKGVEVLEKKGVDCTKEEAANKIKADEEYEEDLKKAIELSLQNEPSTSQAFFNVTLDDSSTDEEIEDIKNRFASAQNYMLEYSGLTPHEITKIMGKTSNRKLSEIKEKKDEEVKQATKELVQSKANFVTVDASKSKNTIFEEEILETNKTDKKKDKAYKSDEEIEIDAIKSSEGVEQISEEHVQNEETFDSSSDDFLEVDEEKSPKDTKNCMEIVVDPNEEIDDLFKDIFEDEENINITKSVENEANKIKEPSLKDKIETVEVVTKIQENEDISDKGKAVVERQEEISRMVEKYTENTIETPKLSVEQMEEMKKNLNKEEIELMAEKSNKERLATNITDQMYQETQELLELFGVPYIIAPMEAEAQCAFLDEIHLTDGTITDDSDIWLFGGRTVYKNFFNHNKHVLEFKSDNIKTHFKLTREQMILLALLVGSDYTTGLIGVGPVTALEILAAFPPKISEIQLNYTQLISGLREFRMWLIKGKTPGPGRTSLKSKLKNIKINENFPNLQVVQAYLEPKIDGNREKFTWSKPDLIGLTEFARIKFGWTKMKTEGILNPVLKRLEERKSQTFIRDYFKNQYKTEICDVQEKMSKRVKTAIKRMGNEVESDEEDKLKKARKRKNQTTSKETENEKFDVQEELSKQAEMVSTKRKRKRKTCSKEEEILEETEQRSKERILEIHEEINEFIKEAEKPKKILPDLHRKDVIPQKQKEKSDMLKSKLKAIEIFRKSKKGPGYVPKKKRPKRDVKEDAGLSESSDD